MKQTGRGRGQKIGLFIPFFNLQEGREVEGENECCKNERGVKGRIVNNIFYL